jgi:HK97 family phage major capsid protein
MNSLIEKRNQLLSEAQRVALGEKTTESRAQLAKMLADVEQLEQDIANEQRLAALVAKSNVATSEAIRQNPTASIPAENRAAGERNAMAEYIRFGQVSAENRSYVRTAETRDIGTVVAGSITTNGGLLVPQSFDSMLHTAQASWGQIAQLVRTKVTDNGATIKVAGADDTANSLVVIGEDAAVSETDPALSGLTSSTDVCTTGVIKVSFAELADSAFNLDSFVVDSFGARYWRGVSNMIVNGSSTTNVASLLTGVTNTVTGSVTGGLTFAFSDYLNLVAKVDPAYLQNAKFAMNNVSRVAALGILDSNNRPIWNISASNIPGSPGSILGYDVALVQQLPNAASAASGTVVFGDFQSAYTFRQVRGDLSILRLNERYAELGMVGFIGYARVGGYNNPLGAAKAIAKLVMHA